ncbi:hypothetical protein [Burkholderia ubonensis]|nr:hypothetical protein [Burkholderia ubonensis]
MNSVSPQIRTAAATILDAAVSGGDAHASRSCGGDGLLSVR